MKKYIIPVISLTAICAIISILLAITNSFTAPIIKKQQDKRANEALLVVLPEGEDFKKVNTDSFKLPATITEAYSEKNGGYVFKITTSGYAGGFVIMCGIDSNGTVVGTSVIAHNETLGYEETYGKKLEGKTIEDIDSVDTISGATKTTLGFRNAVKDSLNAFKILNGGSVDLRTEEEILADNLNSALSSANGKFTNIFITAELQGITSVYKADNDSGYVFVLNDEFIAVDSEGNVLTNTTEENKVSAINALQIIKNEALTEIDITAFSDMPTQILKAYKTSSGNYKFDLRAAGYGINGGDQWNPSSGEYIYIQVSATVDGKIISCETVSQSETDGIGSTCGEASFYTQFNGKTEADYSDIDAISGATITTNGCKKAISKVFEAIKILEGDL